MYDRSKEIRRMTERIHAVQSEMEVLVDRLLEKQMIDVHMAADLLGSPLKVLRTSPKQGHPDHAN